MDCKNFQENLHGFLEKEISNDIQNEMKLHIENCEKCKKIYEEYIKIEQSLNDSFSTDDINFKSHKNDILKSIDKNRYNKKFKYKYLKYKRAYNIAAAIIILIIVIVPAVSTKLYNKTKNKSNVAMDINSSKQSAKEQKDSISEDSNSKNKNYEESAKTENNELKFNFKKTEAKEETIDFHTPWITSPDKKFLLCINGRGESSVEEGMGIISLKDISKDKIYTYTISNPEKQKSPIKAFWYDNQNVMVTVGSEYGTLSYGGDLYIVNLNTSKSELLIKSGELEQITDAEKVDDKLQLKLIVFKDSSLNDYDTENRKIDLIDLNIEDILKKIKTADAE